MTPVEQAKHACRAHWDYCASCHPPVFRCDEGRRLHEAWITEMRSAQGALRPF